mmetsp:Transcript_38668/g.74150  ORF Transcript_38668/g.74150 Transcript_38668/m.74150 type:complete len:203 (-) Transcript_38668:856-1464(-)
MAMCSGMVRRGAHPDPANCSALRACASEASVRVVLPGEDHRRSLTLGARTRGSAVAADAAPSLESHDSTGDSPAGVRESPQVHAPALDWVKPREVATSTLLSSSLALSCTSPGRTTRSSSNCCPWNSTRHASSSWRGAPSARTNCVLSRRHFNPTSRLSSLNSSARCRTVLTAIGEPMYVTTEAAFLRDSSQLACSASCDSR